MDKKRIYIVATIMFIVLVFPGLVLYFGGFFDIDKNNEPDIPVNDTPIGNLKVRIDYDGEFTAGYGSSNKNEDITSNGQVEIDLGDSNYVNIGAKKSDGGTGTLKITILIGNEVVAENSTNDPYEEIEINYNKWS